MCSKSNNELLEESSSNDNIMIMIFMIAKLYMK